MHEQENEVSDAKFSIQVWNLDLVSSVYYLILCLFTDHLCSQTWMAEMVVVLAPAACI